MTTFSGERPEPEPPFASERERMVRDQLCCRGRQISHPLVLQAMASVPRHEFVPPQLRAEAYADYPLPIGYQQTISQPYIVAFMTETLDPGPEDRILEVGTGSGYQTAVLAQIVREIHTVEIVPELARSASATFQRLHILNAMVHQADGGMGWPDGAPYDGILVTCAPHRIPRPLIDQLREGGRMIVPVGDIQAGQELVLLWKHRSRVETRAILPVRFVPMTGSCPAAGPWQDD